MSIIIIIDFLPKSIHKDVFFFFKSIRKIKIYQENVSIDKAFEILERNGKEAERRFYEGIIREVGKEERLEEIIYNFELPVELLGGYDSYSPLLYDPDKKILFIKGVKEIDATQYVIKFLVFFNKDSSSIKRIAFNVTRAKGDAVGESESTMLSNTFLSLSYFKNSDQLIHQKLVKAMEQKMHEILKYSKDIWDIGEINIFKPIALNKADKSIFQKIANDNPIFNFLITKKKNISQLVIDASIFIVSSSQAKGKYEPNLKVILSNYEDTFSPLIFTHELWHHIYHSGLYERSKIDEIFGKYIEKDIKLEEYLNELISSENIEMLEDDKKFFINGIRSSHAENVFKYMARNHPDLTAILIKLILSKPIPNLHNGGEKIRDEGMGWLLGVFVDIDNLGFLEGDYPNLGKYVIRIKSTDVELFADLGVIPDWMRPSKLGFDKEYIDQEYYDLLMAFQP
jgi:hypothetical protein